MPRDGPRACRTWWDLRAALNQRTSSAWANIGLDFDPLKQRTYPY